jgi:hypothetical protein
MRLKRSCFGMARGWASNLNCVEDDPCVKQLIGMVVILETIPWRKIKEKVAPDFAVLLTRDRLGCLLQAILVLISGW